LKVSTNVKIVMQCFENFGEGNAPPGCTPGSNQKQTTKSFDNASSATRRV